MNYVNDSNVDANFRYILTNLYIYFENSTSSVHVILRHLYIISMPKMKYNNLKLLITMLTHIFYITFRKRYQLAQS